MKKSILSIVTMVTLMAGAADADSYLYWMVDVTEVNYGYSATVKGVPSGEGESTYLDLYWVDGGDAITSGGKGAPAGVSSVGKADLQTLAGSGWGFYAGLAANPNYGSYVIELWSDSGDLIGSQPIEATSAAAYIAQNGIGTPATAPWTVAMALPVPEPNSGLLLLIGSAVLALRRRKQGKRA